MLLHKVNSSDRSRNSRLRERIGLFDAGRWLELLELANATCVTGSNSQQDPEEEIVFQNQIQQAKKLIEQGELSHAARIPRSGGLAPANQETLNSLSARPSRSIQDIDPSHLTYQPETSIVLDRKLFVRNLRKARRGLSPGLGDMRNEHMKTALENDDATQDLYEVGQLLARAMIPAEIQDAMRMCRLTAVQKGQNKVRGLNAGEAFRRVVAKTLAP